MKRLGFWSGLAILALATGCDQAAQNMQQAAQDAQQAVANQADEAAAAAKAAGEEAATTVEGAVAEAASLKVGDVDLGKDLTTLFEGLQTTLGEVKDVDTAKAALPKLEEANLGLDKLLGFVDQLPAAAKPALASLLKTHSAAITQSVQKAIGIEGVGEILKPVLDQIVAKLGKAGADEAAPTPAP